MRREKKIQISIFVIIGLVNFALNWLHLLFTADLIDKTIGIFVTAFLPPILCFTILYSIVVVFSQVMRNVRYSEVWPSIILAIASGYIPICIFIYGMQFGGG